MKTSTTMRRIITLGLGAMLIGGVLAPNVSAHDATFDSNVTIRLDGDVFKGTVGNAKTKCQQGRSVTVIKIQKDGDSKVIGSDRTNRAGNWAVPTDPKPERGRYFARARGRGFGGYAHAHRCGGDRSVTINTRN